MKSVIHNIQLITPEITDSILRECSWLLGCGTIYNDLFILGFADPSISKDENFQLYRNLIPKPDGTFDLELAVVLQDFLPNKEGHLEYYLDVADADEVRRLYISNMMVKIRYKNEKGMFHVLAPGTPEFHLIGVETNPIPENAHVELQKTMVACRFTIAGSDAEEALSSNLEQCIDSFIRHLNTLVTAYMMLGNQAIFITSPVYERGSFDFIYMAVRGNEPDRFGCSRISVNVARCMLNPPNLQNENLEALLPYLSETIAPDPAVLLLHSSKSYLDGGLIAYALLQLAIAAEIATTRYVHTRLLSNGVSRTKLKDYEKDITFSQMLNIYVPALTPEGRMPKSAVMGKINRARELRNQLMHEGSLRLTRTEVRQLYEAANEYIVALAAIPSGQLS